MYKYKYSKYPVLDYLLRAFQQRQFKRPQQLNSALFGARRTYRTHFTPRDRAFFLHNRYHKYTEVFPLKRNNNY